MITDIVLATTSILSHFFFVVRTCEFYPLSNSQVYDTLLFAISTILYIRSPNSLIV